MKQEKSPNKPGSEGYVRLCCDCGGNMPWIWGGEITYFQCEKCERIEPCSNIVIEKSKGTVTIEDGNRKEIFAFSPSEFDEVLKKVLQK